ncbi:tail assembly protein [Methylomonas koyamae]|uniref:tail assembly protein n=1 Tax=Methylomonas koyamae TaxID=702114 RepID=UPI0006D16918|nr:tail assembly protein [Methylomonas koyamae]BBL59566.1 hypothetical protein MKFW12EY_31790 [Methylomonas koyamae]
MKTIRLFGELQKYKAEWRLDVKTPAEALRAIDVQRDGFLSECDAGNYAAILIDKNNTELCRRLDPQNANDPWADEELWIMPVASGEIMAPMVVAAFATVGIAVGEVAAMMIAGLLNIAISMAFTAVANMLTSKKRNTTAPQQERPDSKPSFIADGVVNLTAAGHPHPILVGDVPDVGCIILSSDYWVEDVPV